MNYLSKMMPAAQNGLKLVHETPLRLRFKLPFLRVHEFSLISLQILLKADIGVDEVRINKHAASIVFDYDGHPGTRTTIFERLGQLTPRDLPEPVINEEEPVSTMPLVGNLALLAMLPFLGPKAKAALTLFNISSRLIEGAVSVKDGISVELLDAAAVGISAFRGEYLTVNITEFLMKLGYYLEETTLQKSDDMLRHLLRPTPISAWVEKDGKMEKVPDHQIREGDRVIVNVGDRIPIDGLILRGTASVNQSSVTGEAEPVRKEVMDRVVSGSIVEEGRLIIEACHVGAETTTARISSFIEAAIEEVAETQEISDTLSDKRVYLTMGTGAAVFLMSGDITRLESALLVDYSCAIKLGTPLAFKSSLYNAATAGLLIKGGQTIERLAEVDTFVFDKTGTLTYSDLDVTDVVVFDDSWTKKKLLDLTASIEEHANHPIAEAIVAKANKETFDHIEHGEADYLVAHGMRCPVHGDGEILIGSRHFLEDHEDVLFSDHEDTIQALQKEGKILLYIAADKQPLGLVALRDRVREDAAEQLSILRSLGIKKIVMLTGDNQLKAQALAEEIGIDAFHADLEPEDKAGLIRQLQQDGAKVAFVGDGVNDGPALITADVGIAMPRGAEIARATAGVVLLEDELSQLVTALDLSQRAIKLIESNFRLAVGINTAVLFGAVTGRLSPVTTTIMHNGSTIGLLLKALAGVRPRRLEN